MNWPVFRHEAMATTYEIHVAGQPAEYARQAAAAAFRELDRLEAELSRFIESSDIARVNRLARGETITVGEDTLQCLLVAAQVSAATGRAFDPAYASEPAPDAATDAPLFALDPSAHTITSHAARLQLDLGAVGKGYALDRLAVVLGEWGVPAACLQSGGSTALGLDAPAGEAGWPVSLGGDEAPRLLHLAGSALSGSGTAVKGAHLYDPRSGRAVSRPGRVWSLAQSAAVADALSTAFYIMTDAEVAAFCLAYPETGAALQQPDGTLRCHGTLAHPTP